jgi:methionine synthase II (cobalamin-independent)
MAQTKPPYRAEHVGSLPRPERLMAAREQYSSGKLSKAELTQIEDECIREAVAMQERVGIGAITDGEYRKRGWREFLYDKCDGFGCTTAQRLRRSESPRSRLGLRGASPYRLTTSRLSRP